MEAILLAAITVLQGGDPVTVQPNDAAIVGVVSTCQKPAKYPARFTESGDLVLCDGAVVLHGERSGSGSFIVSRDEFRNPFKKLNPARRPDGARQ